MSAMWPRFFVPPPHPLPALAGLRLHLLGARGRGLGPAGAAAVAAGAIVDGCDSDSEGADELLRAWGIPVAPGHDPGHIGERRLVATTLASPSEPEVRAALDAGVAHHRSDLLAALIRGRRPIAVTGAAGKGTVAALVGLGLAELGEDPLVLLGTCAPQLGGPLRVGGGRAVVEADESDGTIARIPAEISVVTNVWFEHAHYPRTLRQTLEALSEHLAAIPGTGHVVLGRGRYMRTLEAASAVPVWRVGRDVRARILSRTGSGTTLRLADPSGSATATMRLTTVAPEQHGALAYAALRVAGHDPEAAASALSVLARLRGRLELVGEAAGVSVYVDHGNQPEQLRRGIAALRLLKPRRLHAVLEPHRNDGIVRWGHRAAVALGRADVVVVLPVNEAGFSPTRRPPDDWWARAGVAADAAPDRTAAVELVARRVRPGDVVCFFGGRASLRESARDLLSALS